MGLKYFVEKKINHGYGVNGIVLDYNIFSISKEGKFFIFREECDGYFSKMVSKEEAICLLKEAIDWVEHEYNK